jgi:uncharacterized sulfatase
MKGRISAMVALGWVGLLTGLYPARAGAGDDRVGRPNVLLILADDMRSDIGAFGNPTVQTPHLDRLAARGVRFERAYCQVPWCNPSRTSMLSGLKPETTRVLGNGTLSDAHLGDRATFLPEHFKSQGYWTARVGKIFHDTPEFQAWASAPRFWDVSDRGHGGAFGKKVAAHKVIHGRGTRQDVLQYTVYDVRPEDTPEYALATRGIELMQAGAASGKPWLVGVGFHKPHLAWQVPRVYWDRYDPSKIPLEPEPPLAEQDIPVGAGAGNTQVAPVSDAERRDAIAAYYACISYVDDQVGRLLDALDASGQADRTIVVFAGDHGYNLGEHYGAWEKMKLWEDTCRLPLILAQPGAAGRGRPSRRIVEWLDLYPTLIDLCGLPQPRQTLDGVSLRPLLNDPNAPWDRAAFTLVPVAEGSDAPDAKIRGRTVRTSRWRYTEFGQGNPGARQLFDHESDPRELHNLADDPAHAATVAELRALLHAGRRQPAADAPRF